MRGRHRANSLRSNGLRALAAGMLLPLVAIGAVYGGYRYIAQAGCDGTLHLTIAASPEIAPAVKTGAARWLKTGPKVGSECISVDVNAVQSADVAAAIADDHGVKIDGLGQSDGKTEVPQVWIPDSSIWLQRMRAVRDDIVPTAATSLATSPVVLAIPEPTAKQMGWLDTKLNWSTVLQRVATDTRMHPGIVDPDRDSVGVATLITMNTVLPSLGAQGNALTVGAVKAFLGGESELPSDMIAHFPRDTSPHSLSTGLTMAPMSEQQLLSYNANDPPVPLAAAYPNPEPVALDFPFATMPRIPTDRATAAEMLRAALTGPDFRNLLAQQQLRASDGSIGTGLTLAPSAPPTGPLTPVPEAGVVQKALNLWAEVTRPARMLAVMDVAASMAAPVAPGVSKEQVAVGAARSGLQLFADSWEVGLWSFSTNMNGNQDYRQLVPIGPLTAQRDQMDGALAGLAPNPAGGTGLYGTLLAAYKTVQTGWDDNHLNSVVIVTGGKNDSGIGLSQLITSLKNIQNPDEPVQVLIIGVGPDVNASDLNQITAVTGGAVFLATDPSQIGDIFLRALALPAGQ